MKAERLRLRLMWLIMLMILLNTLGVYPQADIQRERERERGLNTLGSHCSKQLSRATEKDLCEEAERLRGVLNCWSECC